MGVENAVDMRDETRKTGMVSIPEMEPPVQN